MKAVVPSAVDLRFDSWEQQGGKCKRIAEALAELLIFLWGVGGLNP